jgi:hypothetical protein
MSARPWYREPMLALVIGLPAAAVVAGFATLMLAAGGDAGDARVRRIAQTQTADLAPDHAAARLALDADLVLDRNGAVTLRFGRAAPAESALRLELRHATQAGRDSGARLVHAGAGAYVGRLEAARESGAYNVELAPEAAQWRLVGRLETQQARVRLEPALADAP